jgi:hypothetical protein
VARSRTNPLIKIAVALVVLGGLGVLFMRSVQDVRSEPYTVEPAHLQNWTVALEPIPAANGAMLVLQPVPDLAPNLFRQVFARAGETLARPPMPGGIPILLTEEYNGQVAGRMTPDAVAAAVRETGIESAPPRPRCMAYRRISEPGRTRQVYFVIFEGEGFARARERIGVDPSVLSPVLFIAGADGDFDRWLPLRADIEADCVSPISAG